jgi:hypothetical protein
MRLLKKQSLQLIAGIQRRTFASAHGDSHGDGHGKSEVMERKSDDYR